MPDHLVVVLDPGHGGSNQGLQHRGLVEKEMNLAVANAMKDTLSKFNNVEVYITNPKAADMSLEQRAEYAKSVEADIVVSLHFNMSEEHEMFGSEVWIPATGRASAKMHALGDIFMDQFAEMGLSVRGVKTRLNDEDSDYYGIIRQSALRDIPCILVEHAYADHEQDYDYLDTKEDWQKMGESDAHAVAKFFGLKSDSLKADYTGFVKNGYFAPEEAVGGDESAPHDVVITWTGEKSEEGNQIFRIGGTDEESGIVYYAYSLDGGKTFSGAQPFERDAVEMEIEIPEVYVGSQVCVRLYNGYFMYGESNTVSFQTLDELIEQGLADKPEAYRRKPSNDKSWIQSYVKKEEGESEEEQYALAVAQAEAAEKQAELQRQIDKMQKTTYITGLIGGFIVFAALLLFSASYLTHRFLHRQSEKEAERKRKAAEEKEALARTAAQAKAAAEAKARAEEKPQDGAKPAEEIKAAEETKVVEETKAAEPIKTAAELKTAAEAKAAAEVKARAAADKEEKSLEEIRREQKEKQEARRQAMRRLYVRLERIFGIAGVACAALGVLILVTAFIKAGVFDSRKKTEAMQQISDAKSEVSALTDDTDSDEKQTDEATNAEAEKQEEKVPEIDYSIYPLFLTEESKEEEEKIVFPKKPKEIEYTTVYDIAEGYLKVPLLADARKNPYKVDAFGGSNLEKTYAAGDDRVAIRGVDVSKFQGEIDWAAVHEAGIEFAIIRLGLRGYGSGELVYDDNFYANQLAASEQGLRTGVYFFSQAINEQEAVEEANFVLDAIRELNIDMPIVFDTEQITYDKARTDGLTPNQLTQITRAFCDTIRSAGYQPMIYANAKRFTTVLHLEKLQDYSFWLADYRDKPDYPYDFTMWQFTEKGQVPGIEGNVDINLLIQ